MFNLKKKDTFLFDYSRFLIVGNNNDYFNIFFTYLEVVRIIVSDRKIFQQISNVKITKKIQNNYSKSRYSCCVVT